MKEWLTDIEKRILFLALAREKEVCKKVDRESCIEPNVDILVPIVRSLENKFYYDKIFNECYMKGKMDALQKKEKDITDEHYHPQYDTVTCPHCGKTLARFACMPHRYCYMCGGKFGEIIISSERCIFPSETNFV